MTAGHDAPRLGDRDRHVQERTWPDLAGDSTTLLLIPVGSLEQHGPHLPLGTDTIVASAVAEAVANRLTSQGRSVWVAPALSYGASGEHQHFAGTVSIGHEALGVVVRELVRSASTWVDEIVLVNGHGGNAPTLQAITAQLQAEHHDVRWLPAEPPPHLGQDAHAGHTETCLMLHLAPHIVRFDRADVGCTEPISALLPTLRTSGVRAVSANGVLGDPRSATAEQGRRLFDAMVAALFDRLTTREHARVATR